jgi:uncharacterized phage infection (PIP) family protein YhgE
MASPSQPNPPAGAITDPLPDVRLEVRQAGGRPANYTLSQVVFLIGTVPGCDLRVGSSGPSGTELPALVCMLARHPSGVSIRKLAHGLVLQVNGQAATPPRLADGDRITIGTTEISVRISPAALPSLPASAAPAELQQTRAQLQEAIAQFREQLVRFHGEKEQFEKQRQAVNNGQNPKNEPRPVELDQRFVELQERERLLTERERALEAGTRMYEADVLRLDRQRGNIELRDTELRDASSEMERQKARIQKESAELEEKIATTDALHVQLAEKAQKLSHQEQEQKVLAAQLAQRAASLEGQQATVAALRTRLERLREDLRAREQHLDEQRAVQQSERQHIDQERQELARLREEIENDRRQIEPERQQLVERGALLESAVRQLREAQDRLAEQERGLTERSSELDARTAQVAEQESQLQGRLTQFAEAQERLDAERQALRERSVALTKGEQAREVLQEQLRRRAEELAGRQKFLDEEAARQAQALVEFEQSQTQARVEHTESAQRLTALQDELTRRAADLDQRQAALAAREAAHRTQAEQLAAQSQSLHEEQAGFRHQQEQALEHLGRERAEFEAMRREAASLLEQLPEVELRVGTGLDRLAHARDQLQGHLTEVHQYVTQCHDELERLRARVQVDVDQLEQQEQALRQRHDEHRLTMVAFRQQLIDWQAQITDIKRALAQDGTRLERRHAQVEEKAKEINATSERLAQQAEALQEQQREVSGRRQEVDRHLVDMREWYRRKLRDLAGIEGNPLAPREGDDLAPQAEAPPADRDDPSETEGDEVPVVPVERSILSMRGPVDSGDYKLGETLRTLQFIDEDALTALLAEARRQRRSLRQVLLSSGAITLYQLALIEAGNVGGLMLGPIRVIDRVRSTPLEAVYRVFDPRRGTEAILRHLAEAPMHDAVRPDEFRQRFGQAILSDPHIAATLEVLEINARPAALQEWLTGVPATDWPPLAAAPGVCYRLLTQAARGLNAAHRAGLVHGHLSDAQLLLNADGILKVCGFGEPPWLATQTEEDASTRGDLRALGAMVSGWCTPSGVRRGARAKPLPEALVSILYRLNAEGNSGYASAAELLEDLEKAAGAIPPNAEAWDRLLRYVRDHGTPDAALRRSA